MTRGFYLHLGSPRTEVRFAFFDDVVGEYHGRCAASPPFTVHNDFRTRVRLCIERHDKTWAQCTTYKKGEASTDRQALLDVGSAFLQICDTRARGIKCRKVQLFEQDQHEPGVSHTGTNHTHTQFIQATSLAHTHSSYKQRAWSMPAAA